MTYTEELHRTTPPGPPPPGPARGWPWERWALIVVVALVLIAAAVAVVVAAGDNESTTTTTAIPTSTTLAPSTTAPPTTAPSTTAPPTTLPVDTATAVWPTEASGIRYGDPVAAARGFAVDYLGFVDPVVGEFMQGDTRSGEIEISATDDGPATLVLVRQLSGSDDWWVLGATTANIRLETPEAFSVITSPVRLQGVSTAFEANVSVEVRDDASIDPIGEGFVMGGSMGEMGPFDGTVAFDAPAAGSGAIVLYTVSMENGQIWEAAVIRVAFA